MRGSSLDPLQVFQTCGNEWDHMLRMRSSDFLPHDVFSLDDFLAIRRKLDVLLCFET
jgi:hypothetical protein